MGFRPPDVARLIHDPKSDAIETTPAVDHVQEDAAVAVNVHWIQKLFGLTKSRAPKSLPPPPFNPHLLTDVTNIVNISVRRLRPTAHDDLTTVIREFAPPREVTFKRSMPFLNVVDDAAQPGGKIVEYNLYNESSLTHIAPGQVERFERAIARFAEKHAILLLDLR